MMFRVAMSCSVLALCGVAGATVCLPHEQSRLTASDGASGDHFGKSVSIDGDVAVIGVPYDDDNGSSSGSVYVYERGPDGDWLEQAKLTALDASDSDWFGFSVSISGDLVAIGAQSGGNPGLREHVYVFERQSNGLWLEQAKLSNSDWWSGDRFGKTLCISGGIMVMGAYEDNDNGYGSGSAYVFERQADGTWLEHTKLTASDGENSDYFGYSVGISGHTVMIGAYKHDNDDDWSDSGCVYVYKRQANGIWQEQDQLFAGWRANFGSSVSISGGRAVIGAPLDDDNGNNSGSAYVFERQADGTWLEHTKLTASDEEIYDSFGCSVGISGDIAVIGAVGDDDYGNQSGGGYVFERQPNDTWVEQAKLTPSDGASEDKFGSDVSISGDIAVIGAVGDDDNGPSSGSAYVYERQIDGTWNPNAAADCNSNGVCDFDDLMSGVSQDCNENGIPDECDTSDGTSADCNGNGIPDVCDIADGTSFDCDQDLVPDECEIDCDGDGLIDDCDSEPDQDGNGVPDNCDPDCNDNGIADGVEVLFGWADDCDGDVVPDECQLADGSATDCDKDGTLDHCQIEEDPDLDCDEDGVIDSCAVDGGLVADCNENGIPDSCEISDEPDLDCDGDGILDPCAIADGVVGDCNENGIPDSCDLSDTPIFDCDGDGLVDSCAIEDGVVQDCNENGRPDSCDFADGGDANGDGVLDECECHADIAGPDGPGFPDGIVGTDDLLTVIGYWGSSQPNGDVNGDGIVGTDDLLAVIGAWGPCE